VRAQQPPVRPGHRSRLARWARRLPDVRRRPQRRCHRADSRDLGRAPDPSGVLPGGRARAALSRRRAPRRRPGPCGRQSHPAAPQAAFLRPGPHPRRARIVTAHRWRWRWLWWPVGLVGAALALKFLAGFPWRVTVAALFAADPWLLAVALVVNLSSLAAKGWAWHLILKPVAPHGWRTAQEANLVGSAVNDLSVAVAGDAARVQLIAREAGGPVGV